MSEDKIKKLETENKKLKEELEKIKDTIKKFIEHYEDNCTDTDWIDLTDYFHILKNIANEEV